jgi:predicted small lipoprotein YifL
MSRRLHLRPRLADLPLAVVAVIALGLLGSCGIKGPLRLPPPAPGSAPASSPSGAAPAPATAPAQPPEEIHAEPPAVPAEPADPRKP